MKKPQAHHARFPLLVALMLLGLLLLPRLIETGLVNLSQLILLHSLDSEEEPYGTGWIPGLVTMAERGPLLDEPRVGAVRAAVGHMALVTGDLPLASRMLLSQGTTEPVELVRRVQERGGLNSAREIDRVVAYLLREAQRSLEAGKSAEGSAYLDAALLLRPATLWAHYGLLDDDPAGDHLRALRYFNPEALLSASPALLPFMVESSLALEAEAIWSRSQLERVVAMLVWHYGEQAETERLVRSLMAREPDEPQWTLYLGELYERQGRWQEAEALYRSLLTLEEVPAGVYFRLGESARARAQVAPTSDEQRAYLAGAARWYSQYQLHAPQDDLVVQRLATLAGDLEAPLAAQVTQRAQAQGPQHQASLLLDLPLTTIQLGENLLSDDPPDSEPAPTFLRYWRWEPHDSPPHFDRAAFYGAVDPLPQVGGSFSPRILGFWQQTDSGPDRSRAGYLYRRTLLMPPRTTWLVTFWYRTSGTSQRLPAGVWMTGTPTAGFQGEMRLPPTQGEWRQEAILLHNQSTEAVRVQPLFRSWDVGSLWYTQVSIYPLHLPDDLALPLPPRLLSWD